MPDPRLLVCAPLWLEARPLRRALGRRAVVRTGFGPHRNARSAARLDPATFDALAVAGLCGGVTDLIRPGDVVVASEVRGANGTIDCPTAPLLVTALRRRGFTVHSGPIITREHVVRGEEYGQLAEAGALAADMESAVLAAACARRPFAVVRIVVDTPRDPLASLGTARRALRALASLTDVGEVLAEWAAATTVRQLLLAAPRSFCAGVERAIDIVEQVLDQRGAPVYVRKQIVHNAHVVAALEQRGAVFVEELDEVPDAATVVFSAHGVSPEVRTAAASRGLDVVDATCPLVTKVHSEARRFASYGQTVVLIGHAGHEEVVGTMGEAPEVTVLVQDEDDVAALQVDDPDRVSYLMQTTLSMDESQGIVAALRARFPNLRGPRSDDICYATSNRQRALAQVAAASDMVLVIGSDNSSNSRRLVELAVRSGTPAHLIDRAEDVDLRWLAAAHTVGVSAGASAPPVLVDELLAALSGLGPVEVAERRYTTEDVHFTLPKEVS